MIKDLLDECKIFDPDTVIIEEAETAVSNYQCNIVFCSFPVKIMLVAITNSSANTCILILNTLEKKYFDKFQEGNVSSPEDESLYKFNHYHEVFSEDLPIFKAHWKEVSSKQFLRYGEDLDYHNEECEKCVVVIYERINPV